MRVLDLFSGIGGFSLGLERAGMETVAFCEIDPFCQKVLRKHWPDVPIYNDVKELTNEEARGLKPDVICGGFPCQPFSTASAGKRGGKTDDRALWPEMLRIIRAAKPRWVVAENVTGIISMALSEVVLDLERAGYCVWLFIIPACAVGHDHRRERVWILAHSDSGSQPSGSLNAETQVLSGSGGDTLGMGKNDGVSRGMDRLRLRSLGNAVVPQIPEIIGRAIMEQQ